MNTTFSGLHHQQPAFGFSLKRGIIGEEKTVADDKPFMPTFSGPQATPKQALKPGLVGRLLALVG